MLNKFKVTYRGVEITPQIKHFPMKDVLEYEYNGYRVIVTVDIVLANTMQGYEELIKDCVIRELEDNNVL